MVGAPPDEGAEEDEDPDDVERVPASVGHPDPKFPEKAATETKFN